MPLYYSSQEFRVTDAVEGFRLLAYDITLPYERYSFIHFNSGSKAHKQQTEAMT